MGKIKLLNRLVIVILLASVSLYGLPAYGQFSVTNTNDEGPGSLRQAMLNTLEAEERSTISFKIPGDIPHTIYPESPLPILSNPVVIDGTTQPGYTDSPVIEISGEKFEYANGFIFEGGNSEIKGLVINDFLGIPLLFQIGGNNVVEHNYIGTDITGTEVKPNGGFAIFLSDVGDNILRNNLISGNNIGIYAQLENAINNKIINNKIGTDVSGNLPLGNELDGIRMMSGPRLNTISGNIIAANGDYGIHIFDAINIQTGENTITENQIGPNKDQDTNLANGAGGVFILGSYDNDIVSNVISGNDGSGVDIIDAFSSEFNKARTGDGFIDRILNIDGVDVSEETFEIRDQAEDGINTTGNKVSQNIMFRNAGIGIDLGGDGITENDEGDIDTGPNNLQNLPAVQQVRLSTDGGELTVGYLIDSNPEHSTYPILTEFYVESESRQGEIFLGSALYQESDYPGVNEAVLDVSDVKITAGDKIIATATDAANNTSEFGNPVSIFSSDIVSPVLIFPENNSSGVSISPTLKWQSVDQASYYSLEVSRDGDFQSVFIEAGNIEEPEYALADLKIGTTYYWRVKAHSSSGASEFSDGWSFTTGEAVTVPVFADNCIEQEIDVKRAIRGCVGEINFSQFSALLEPGNQQLQLSLFGGEITAVATETNTEVWSENEFSWFGKFQSGNYETIVLEVDLEEQRVFATMMFNNRPYRLEYIEGSVHAIYEVDLRGLIDEPEGFEDELEDDPLLDEFDPINPQEQTNKTEGILKYPETGHSNHTDPVIDLLILYTQQAKDSSGSHRSIRQEIRNAVNTANITFQNSGVNARVRLADMVSVTYNESGKTNKTLRHLRANGQHKSTDVYNFKKQSGADIVGMVVGEIDACGVAYFMKNESTNHRKKSYMIVKQGFCLGNNLSFAHEIGHIMGARHDREVDNRDGGSFDYNHGFVNPSSNWPMPGIDSLDAAKQWRTVMAYNDACDDEGEFCRRIRNWSDPDSTLLGEPMGIASGNSAADNVRALNNTASTVAAFSDALPSVFGFITDVQAGAPLEGAEVVASDGRSVTTDENGFYEFLVSEGDDLDIEPELQGYLFQPESNGATNITDDVQIDFEAFPLYNITGRITESGTPLEDIEMRGAPGNTPETNANGEYELTLPFGWSGTITPYSRAYSFTPESRDYNNLSADEDNQNYSAELNSYVVSGSIRDLTTGNMVSDVLLDGFPQETKTNSGGFYSIEIDHGWSGTITPVKRGFSFEPLNREYINLSGARSHDYDAFSGWLARSDWPMFNANPQHTGAVNIQAVNKTVRWSDQLDGKVISSVVGPDGTIYVGTEEGELYFYSSAGQRTGNIGFVNAITATPALSSDNRLYLPFDETFRVVTLHQSISTKSLLTIDDGGFYSSPVINHKNGMIYIGSDTGEIYALNPNDAIEWTFSTDGQVRSSPALSPDGTIIVGSDDNNIYAINPDGTQKWSYSTGGDVRSSPAVGSNGTVYVGSDDSYLYAIDPNGSLKWRFSTGGPVQSSPAIDSNGNLYVGSDDGVFYAIDDSGNLNWSFSTGGPVKSSPAISQARVRLFTEQLDEEVVYVGSEDGFLYAFDIISLGSNSGSPLRWKYDFESPVSASPILTNGMVAGSEDGKLISFRQVSRAWTQGVVLAQDDVPTPDELAIIIWMDEIGGPSGVISGNPGLDRCEGGPLVIPNCPFEGGFFGKASPFLPVFPDEELIIGLARASSDLESILEGETTEGLLGTFNTTVTDTDATSLFFGGVVNSEGYAENPDGRPIGLQMFSKTGLRETATNNPEETSVYAGHFSTDSPAIDITMSGPVNKTFNSLRYGDISGMQSLPAGNYQVTLKMAESAIKTRRQDEFTYELDLTGSNGEPVAIIVDGFLNPEANKNGPSLGLNSISSKGSIPTGIKTETPQIFALHNNYPNPFNPVTTIPFDIKETGVVRLEIYNIAGQKVLTLVDDILSPGRHETPFDASEMASGVYIYRMITDTYSESKKMVLIK